MAEGLPQGLVSTNEAVTSDIQSFERIQVEDIKRLWQGRASPIDLAHAIATNIVLYSLLCQPGHST